MALRAVAVRCATPGRSPGLDEDWRHELRQDAAFVAHGEELRHGARGRDAVTQFLAMGYERGVLPELITPVFV